MSSTLKESIKSFITELIKLFLISTIPTLILLLIEAYSPEFAGVPIIQSLISFNNYIINEIFDIYHTILWMMAALAPGLIALIMCIKLEEKPNMALIELIERKNIKLSTYCRIFKCGEWKEKTDKIFNLYLISNITTKKIGISITCTLTGVALF